MTNRVFAFVSTATLLVLFCVSPASAATKVFILAGQSNMVGEGGYDGYMHNPGPGVSVAPIWTNGFPATDAACPAPYNTPSPTVKFWNYNPNNLTYAYGNGYSQVPGIGNGWDSLQPGYGNRLNEFGPEVSFGARMQELYPNDQIYLVKYAVGGTDLGYQWNPATAASHPADSLYLNMKNRVNAALASLSGQNPTVAGMIWMQGENDSTIPDYAAAYAGNLKSLIDSVRSDFNAPDMRFVTARITKMTQDAGWATEPNCTLVRNAQQYISAVDSNAASFNTDDLEKAFYGHYGTAGQIELGLRFANFMYVPVPEPSTFVLGGIGLLGLIAYAWRKRK
jgi:hypothetical protein